MDDDNNVALSLGSCIYQDDDLCLASSCSTSCMSDFVLDWVVLISNQQARQRTRCVPLEKYIWHAHERTISHYLNTTDPPPSPLTWCQMWLLWVLRQSSTDWMSCGQSVAVSPLWGDSRAARFNNWVTPKRILVDVCLMTCEVWFLCMCAHANNKDKKAQTDTGKHTRTYYTLGRATRTHAILNTHGK